MARPSLTAVPAQRSSLPVLKIRRRVILGLCAGSAAVGLFSGIAWLTAPEYQPAMVAARDEAAVSLATIVANDYVLGKDTSVPVADGIDPLFSRATAGAFTDPEVTFAGSSQVRLGDTAAMTLERSEFHVTVRQGETSKVYELSIAMAQTSRGWILASSPSIAPATLAPAVKLPQYGELFAGGGDSSDLNALPSGAKVTEQVNRWAQAYAAGGVGDPNLFALTQDNDASHSYDGLGGWTVQNVTVLSFTQGSNSAESAKRFGDRWLTVRVALVLAPPAANGPTLKTEYDLLLQPEMNPANPPVTAWGPAGVGPTSALVNYANNTNG